MVSIGKGVGQPANQVRVGRLLAAGVQRYVTWRIAFSFCLVRWFGFQVIRFYRFCHGFGWSVVSPHGRGVLRIV